MSQMSWDNTNKYIKKEKNKNKTKDKPKKTKTNEPNIIHLDAFEFRETLHQPLQILVDYYFGLTLYFTIENPWFRVES